MSATTTNPQLQAGDTVYIVLKGQGEIPNKNGARLVVGQIKEITWDSTVNFYKYRVAWDVEDAWISESVYNSTTGESITKTYNTARSAFRALADANL